MMMRSQSIAARRLALDKIDDLGVFVGDRKPRLRRVDADVVGAACIW